MSGHENSDASLIRQALDELGWHASTKDVNDYLAADKVEVTAQQVSNEKSKRAKHPVTQLEDLPVSLLKKVKALVDEIGSVELVRRALDDLEALTSAKAQK